MRSGVPMRLVLCLGVLAGAAGAQPAPASLPVTVTLGVEGDGTATAAWRDALRVWHGDEALGLVLRDQHALTEEEAAWAALIQRRAPAWARMTDSLRLPFEGVVPPDTVHVVLGNVGGQDAFTFSDSTMGFDLQRLGALYEEATAAENGDRIDRFFAHEFTHLMHKAWRKARGLALASPLDRALWDCLVEGLGNYRSLSGRWVEPDGALTPHARDVLARLQPVFVARLAALEHASEAEAAGLMEGLSSGPFDQKWGALTVALWLAQEARGDDRRLRRWVEAGPRGVLTLARTYLPEDLRSGLPH